MEERFVRIKDVGIRWKLMAICVLGLILISIVSAYQRIGDIRQSAEAAILGKSRTVVLMAESTRNEMSKKLAKGVIKPLDQLSGDALLEAVPIVTAMNVAMENAKSGGFVFRVPKTGPRNPANEPTPLESDVLKEFQDKNLPEKIIYEANQIRYFKPIRLTSECLYCHGDPKGSKDPLGGTKEGWHEGEVHGAFEVVGSLAEADAAVYQAKIHVAFWTIGMLLAVCGVVWFMLEIGMIRPMKTFGEFIGAIASGDMTSTLAMDSRDEFGQMAGQLNAMSGKLRSMFREIMGGVGSLSASSGQLSDIAVQMQSGATDTSERARTVAVASEEMSSNMNSVAAASEEISTNVTMVSTAAEEMTETVGEIARSTENARGITAEIVNQAQSASARLDNLRESTNQIGKISDTITGISSQTNLLALNATIEAARAGEAGKGFTVVANEIKDLARQTATATEEIKREINEVQEATVLTVKEIKEILRVIDDIGNAVAMVATAAEEQTATTREIAGNISEASVALREVTENVAQASVVSGEIARDISNVNHEAMQMSGRSSEVKLYALELARLGQRLQQFIGQFKIGEQRFDIGKVKTAHLGWRTRVEAAVAGSAKLSPEEVTSHHDCAFGKWYYSPEGQKMADNPIYAQIGKYHEEVHRTAREIAVLVQKGLQSDTSALMKRMDDAREQLFTLLDQLYAL